MEFKNAEEAKTAYIEAYRLYINRSANEDDDLAEKIYKNEVIPAIKYLEDNEQLHVFIPALKQDYGDDDYTKEILAFKLVIYPQLEEICIEIIKKATQDDDEDVAAYATNLFEIWKEKRINTEHIIKRSEQNEKAFLYTIHQNIYESVEFALSDIKKEEPILLKENMFLEKYEITDQEEQFRNQIKDSPFFHSIIKKMLTETLNNAFFNLLCFIDGTGEPLEKYGKVADFLLIDRPDDYEKDQNFLHDLFHESFEEWERLNKTGK